jgi:hypothetical protein
MAILSIHYRTGHHLVTTPSSRKRRLNVHQDFGIGDEAPKSH